MDGRDAQSIVLEMSAAYIIRTKVPERNPLQRESAIATSFVAPGCPGTL